MHSPLVLDSGLIRRADSSDECAITGSLHVFSELYERYYSATVILPSVNINLRFGSIQHFTLTCDCQFILPTSGQQLLLVIQQDAVGNHAVSFDSSVHFTNDASWVVTPTALRADILSLVRIGTVWVPAPFAFNVLLG